MDVVLDPALSSKMRSHQKEGVQVGGCHRLSSTVLDIQFMYANVMGLSGADAEGCILADEMGLGKTLQTIGLIATLLSESPRVSFAQGRAITFRPSNISVSDAVVVGHSLTCQHRKSSHRLPRDLVCQLESRVQEMVIRLGVPEANQQGERHDQCSRCRWDERLHGFQLC